MPGFICPSHGNTFLSNVCEHIGLSIDSKSLPERINIIVMRVGHVPGDAESPMLFKGFYCYVCVELYNLPAEDTLLPDGAEEESLPDIFVPTCSDCFAEALAHHGVDVGGKLRALLTGRLRGYPELSGKA
ncbi:MAG TPA: hypothetical protein VK363_10050 [Pyrinomonadaceae bacterium]|nr:hypothetical protein [Pyrinomonadaceae bacterium]